MGALLGNKEVWNDILKRLEKCLSCWKTTNLLKGKFFLVWFFSLFPDYNLTTLIPWPIALEIFGLEWLHDEHKFHLVNWNTNCSLHGIGVMVFGSVCMGLLYRNMMEDDPILVVDGLDLKKVILAKFDFGTTFGVTISLLNLALLLSASMIRECLFHLYIIFIIW